MLQFPQLMTRLSSKLQLFFLLGSICLSVGCATVGRDFSFSQPSQIKIGTTTKNAIAEKFGDPFRVGFENGHLKWTYGYYKYRLFGDSDTKDLAITFDKDGIVKEYTFSTSMEEEKENLSKTIDHAEN